MSNIHMALTTKGKALAAKIQAGVGTIALEITRVASAVGRSNDPTSLTVLDVRQMATITRREVVGTRAIIQVLLTNQYNPANGGGELTESYQLTQFGMYATDPDEGEILYRISQLDMPIYVPAASEMPWTATPSWDFSVENASDVVVNVDPAGLVTVEMLNRALFNIDGGLWDTETDLLEAHNHNPLAHEMMMLDGGEMPEPAASDATTQQPITDAVEAHDQNPDAHPNLYFDAGEYWNGGNDAWQGE